MNRRKAIAGVIGSIGALALGSEAEACTIAAHMQGNSSSVTKRIITGQNTCGGSTEVRLYTGGWSFIGSAWVPSGNAYLTYYAPATSYQKAYWVRVYVNGVKRVEKLFYRYY